MSGDPYYDNVSLLLHFDGTDGSTTFTDNSPSPKTVTVYGNAHIETDQSQFGGASGAFDGNGDYLTVPAAAFTFAGDFTIECWVYLNAASGYVPIMEGRAYATYSNFICGLYPNNIDFVTNVGRLTATDTLAINTWHHIAVTRASGVIRLFTNGVVNAETFSYATDITPAAANVRIGNNVDGNFLNGYLDDIRITKGVARYTDNFTPPTEAFANDVGILVVPLALAAFAPYLPGQIETVLFGLQAFGLQSAPILAPTTNLALGAYPVELDGILLPAAIEFRHAPLTPWVMPMTSPVYPPAVTVTLTMPLPGVSIRGLWSPADALFGWAYNSGTDTISIPIASLFELTAGQADAVTGDWRAVALGLVNSLWDAYIELDDPPRALILAYNPGYMHTTGPFKDRVRSEYTAQTYLNFPEKTLADEP